MRTDQNYSSAFFFGGGRCFGIDTFFDAFFLYGLQIGDAFFGGGTFFRTFFWYGLRIGVAVAVQPALISANSSSAVCFVAIGAFFLSDIRVTTMVDEYSGAIESATIESSC